MAFATEVEKTIKLASPLILGQIASMAIGFVDSVMAGRIDALALAAVAIGNAVWIAGLLFIIGVLMAIPPHISQLAGAGRVRETGAYLHQATFLAIALALGFFLFLRSAAPILNFTHVDPEIIPVALGYLDAISWGAPGICGFLLLRYLSEGLSLTRPAMYFGFLGLLINIPANYILMFGHLGFPAMGAVGCGYASSLVLWIQFIGILLYIRHHGQYQDARLFKEICRPEWQTVKEILHIGLPIGLATFIEGSLFVTVALLMGSLGPVTAAAHQIAINFAALVFMVPLGLSMAITVRVGNAVGRRDADGVRRAASAGFTIVLITQLFSAGFMLLFPDLIATLYTDDAEVRKMVFGLLFLAAIFQLPDGFQVAGAGALRGLKDTKIPMLFTIIAYWLIGLPLGYGLGIYAGYGAEGMWSGLIAGLSVAAILMIVRFQLLSKDMSAHFKA